MPDCDKVFTHPDFEEINALLTEGRSIEYIVRVIKERYPRNKKLHISNMLLQRYRTQHRDELKEAITPEIVSKLRAEDKQLQTRVDEGAAKAATGYYLRRSQALDQVAEISDQATNLFNYCQERIEVLSKLSTDHRNDKVICDYISQLRGLMNDSVRALKSLESSGSSTVNITLNQIQNYQEEFKKALQRTLVRMGDANFIASFMQIFIEEVEAITAEGQPKKLSTNVKGPIDIQINARTT